MSLSFFLQVAGMFIIPLVAVIVPVLIGQRYGIMHSKLNPDIQHNSIDSVVSAAFGLLAFMLAFTFQIAANRYDDRKAMLIEEVKNVRTTYLRAGLLPEPFNSGTKKHLVEYVDLRVDLLQDNSKLHKVISDSKVILDSLWKYAEELAIQDRSSEVYALYTSSVNDLVDAYNERIIMVFVYRIPAAVIWVLFILVFLSMLVLGYQFGLSGKRSSGVIIMLAVIFAVVMFLISALDRPEMGLVQLDQNPLMTLKEQLQKK